MNKLLFLLPLAAVAILNAPASYADRDHGWGGEHGGHHHGHHHGHHDYYQQPRVVYYSQPPVYYAPPPPVRYYPQPAPQYYAEPPRYSNYQDPRSHQGLAGGVIGSVLGYELGSGDPVATGLGAAAGSFFGNGMGRY